MNNSFNLSFLMILSGVISTTTAFTTSTCFHQQQHKEQTFLTSTTSLNVVWDPKHNAEHNIMNGEDGALIDFPTPAQRTALKKEAAKRQARKKLPLFSLPSSDQLGSYSDETLESIWALLQEHELVQIKGFASETKERKLVYSLAMKLCFQLEWEQERQINDDVSLPVAMLSYKGHSAILYSPTLDNDHPKKFVLRTSVGQKNTWTARIKAPRDHRGQIIRE